jgi:putative transposase
LGTELKAIYQAENAVAAEMVLTAFEQSRIGMKWSSIAQTWRRQWAQVIPFFRYPSLMRRTIYATSTIVGLLAHLRKLVKIRGRFPSDDATTMLLYLALRNITKN